MTLNTRHALCLSMCTRYLLLLACRCSSGCAAPIIAWWTCLVRAVARVHGCWLLLGLAGCWLDGWCARAGC